MSAILTKWVEGRGLPGELVIDGHIHIGEWVHAATFNSFEDAAVNSIRLLDENGVDAYCALAGGYMNGLRDYRIGNDFLLRLWDIQRERMIPFMGMNPNDTQVNVLAELRRMYGAGVRCIKLLNFYQNNYPGDGPNLMALYEFAAERGMIVLNHHWTEAEITKLAAMFPAVEFIFGHYGGGYQDDVMARFPNVNANIWNYGPLGWLDDGVKKLGASRFMMGSDGFANCLTVGIGPVVFADIYDDDKRLMLGLNAARLLDKAGALPGGLKKRWLNK